MEAGKGKKGKKAGWQLKLGLREAVFAGLGVAGIIMMSFALGTLAGRGDIYRVLHNWGLVSADAPKLVQSWTPPGVSGAPGAPSPSPSVSSTVPVAAAPAPAPPPAPIAVATAPAVPAPAAVPQTTTAQARPEPTTPAPVKGSIAALPGTPAAKKKAKTPPPQRDQKAKEEELRHLRMEVSKKLKFQNSFDTTPPSKTARQAPKTKSKEKDKPKEKAAAPPAKPAAVQVAQFRDGKTAKAKLAELQKRGDKVTLKQTKDQKGTVYTIYRQSPAKAQEDKNLAQTPRKSTETKRKPATATKAN